MVEICHVQLSLKHQRETFSCRGMWCAWNYPAQCTYTSGLGKAMKLVIC
jgi:hypothetical protein